MGRAEQVSACGMVPRPSLTRRFLNDHFSEALWTSDTTSQATGSAVSMPVHVGGVASPFLPKSITSASLAAAAKHVRHSQVQDSRAGESSGSDVFGPAPVQQRAVSASITDVNDQSAGETCPLDDSSSAELITNSSEHPTTADVNPVTPVRRFPRSSSGRSSLLAPAPTSAQRSASHRQSHSIGSALDPDNSSPRTPINNHNRNRLGGSVASPNTQSLTPTGTTVSPGLGPGLIPLQFIRKASESPPVRLKEKERFGGRRSILGKE